MPVSISVVIPAFNSMKYLRETLDSVLNQTILPNEVLVIDDGSTDNTAAFAESYGLPVRVFRRTNQRQAASRNFGIQAATCEWIALLDHDDVWEPNKLERQMEELARHPEADLCYTGRVLLIQKGDTTILGRVIDVPPAEDIKRARYEGVTFLPSAVLIRRSAILAIGGFDPKICHGSDDYDMWLRLLHAGAKFAACREPLVQYRRHEGNWSLDTAWFDEYMEIYRRLVLPYLPKSSAGIAFNRFRSAHECDLAFALRERGNPTCLSMMARSILHSPFVDPLRYKVLAHMLFSRVIGRNN
jgi:glycosyltransferase involved in cell wall biosynthesis